MIAHYSLFSIAGILYTAYDETKNAFSVNYVAKKALADAATRNAADAKTRKLRQRG